MKPSQGFGKVAAFASAALLAFAVTSLSSLAASQFEGTWKTAGGDGSPMEITMSADGVATGAHFRQSNERDLEGRR